MYGLPNGVGAGNHASLKIETRYFRGSGEGPAQELGACCPSQLILFPEEPLVKIMTRVEQKNQTSFIQLLMSSYSKVGNGLIS
jgi:hypothetical protein